MVRLDQGALDRNERHISADEQGLGNEDLLCQSGAWGHSAIDAGGGGGMGLEVKMHNNRGKHSQLEDGEEEIVHCPRVALGWHLGGRGISPSVFLSPKHQIISGLTGTRNE